MRSGEKKTEKIRSVTRFIRKIKLVDAARRTRVTPPAVPLVRRFSYYASFKLYWDGKKNDLSRAHFSFNFRSINGNTRNRLRAFHSALENDFQTKKKRHNNRDETNISLASCAAFLWRKQKSVSAARTSRTRKLKLVSQNTIKTTSQKIIWAPSRRGPLDICIFYFLIIYLFIFFIHLESFSFEHSPSPRERSHSSLPIEDSENVCRNSWILSINPAPARVPANHFLFETRRRPTAHTHFRPCCKYKLTRLSKHIDSEKVISCSKVNVQRPTIIYRAVLIAVVEIYPPCPSLNAQLLQQRNEKLDNSFDEL